MELAILVIIGCTGVVAAYLRFLRWIEADITEGPLGQMTEDHPHGL